MSWNDWASLGGLLAGGKLAVGRNLDGRLEVFGEMPGAAGPELAHVWQTSANGGWSGWSSLGPPPQQFLGGLAVGSNADGRLEAFARVGLMSSGELWHMWQTAPGAGWSAWSGLGGEIGPHVLAIGQNPDGRLELFAVSADGTLRHIWQTSPNGGWSAWSDLSAPSGASLTSGLAAGQNLDGRLEVFAVGTDGALWHIWQQPGGWSGWDSLSSPGGLALAGPVVAANEDGRLEVFATVQGELWHSWQSAPGGTWAAWGNLGMPSSSASLQWPATARNADGRLEAFAVGSDTAVWHIWQASAGGGWDGWDTLGGQPGAAPSVGQNADGRLEVFVEDNAVAPHAAWHRWQVSPGGGWVSVAGWQTHGPAEAISAVALSPAGVLLAAGASGVWQSANGGDSWTKVSASLLGSSISFGQAGDPVWAVSHDGKQVLASSDGGATWTTHYTASGQAHLNAVLADPNTAGTVWVGMSAADTLAEVLRSTNSGASWMPVLPPSLRGGGGLSATNAGPLAALSGAAGLVLSGAQYYHGGGVLRTADGGASWTLAYPDTYTPLAGASALAVRGASAVGATIYAGLNVMQFGSLVRSDDGGLTWVDVSAELPLRGAGTGGYVANVVTDPGQADGAYISMWDTSSPARTGVFSTADRGQTWTEIDHLEPRVAGPSGLALDSSAHVLYAATAGGVYSYAL